MPNKRINCSICRAMALLLHRIILRRISWLGSVHFQRVHRPLYPHKINWQITLASIGAIQLISSNMGGFIHTGVQTTAKVHSSRKTATGERDLSNHLTGAQMRLVLPRLSTHNLATGRVQLVSVLLQDDPGQIVIRRHPATVRPTAQFTVVVFDLGEQPLKVTDHGQEQAATPRHRVTNRQGLFLTIEMHPRLPPYHHPLPLLAHP